MFAQAMIQARPPPTTEGAPRLYEDKRGYKRLALDDRPFKDLKKFGGSEAQWKEWDFNFLVTVVSADKTRDVKNALLQTQKLNSAEVTTKTLDEGMGLQKLVMFMRVHSGALYNKIVLATTGEANLVVRGVEDFNGFVAYKMYDRYNPMTSATMIQAYMQVINRVQQKDVRQLGRVIEE